MTRTELSLFGTFGGTFPFNPPSLARSSRAFDFSSSDFTSALVCRSPQLAHSPCHSCTTSLLETCAVKASSPPTMNVYGASLICDPHGVRNVPVILAELFQSKSKVPSCAFDFGLRACATQMSLPSSLKAVVLSNITAKSRVNWSGNSANIIP